MKLRYSNEPLRDLLLRSLQDNTLEPSSCAPAWTQELAAAFHQDLGLLALHGISGLAEQLSGQPPIRVPLGPSDNVVLHLAHDAVQRRRHLALAVPPGAVMMPLLMVCKTLLGNLLEKHESLGALEQPEDLISRGGILLVSPEVELRARYFSMQVGSQSVVDAYPAGRMRPDGSVAPITKASDQQQTKYSVCFFLAHQKLLPNPQDMSFTPAVILLDLMHDHWIDRLPDLIEWSLQLRNAQGERSTLIALFPLGDKNARDALTPHQIPIYPLDYAGMFALSESFGSSQVPSTDISLSDIRSGWSFDSYVAEKPLDREHTVFFVHGETEHSVQATVSSIYKTLDSIHMQSAHRDLRLAGWLVGTLTQLPIPIQWYEQHAYLMGNRQTLKRLISGIGNSSGGAQQAALAPVLQSLRGQLDLLYTRLSEENPKSTAFLRYYRERLEPIVDSKRQALALTRNDVAARAIWPWLMSEGVPQEYQPFLRVLPYRQIDGRQTFDHIVATGPWPGRYRWQIGGRLGKAIDFLLYPGEEVIIQQQMAYFYGMGARMQFERSRLKCLEEFGDIQDLPTSVDQSEHMRTPDLNLNVPQSAAETMPSESEIEDIDDAVDMTVRSLFKTAALDESMSTSESSTITAHDSTVDLAGARHWVIDAPAPEENYLDTVEDAPGQVSSITEACILFKVRQVRASDQSNAIHYIYLETDGTTECYIPGQGSDELTPVANEEIEPGFIIIRTDEDDRQSLFDRVIQLADAQPTMKYLKVWRDYWLEAILSLVQTHASGRAKRGSYQQLQRDLAAAGVRVTLATIRGWVLGERIGPASIESVRGVASLSQHPMLLRYPDRVDAAFKQIRTIHQVLGRRISSMLQGLGKSMRQVSTGEESRATRTQREVHLDPALAVPIDDLIDLLEFFEVVSVNAGSWEAPTSRVGVLLHRPQFGGE